MQSQRGTKVLLRIVDHGFGARGLFEHLFVHTIILGKGVDSVNNAPEPHLGGLC